MSPTASALLLLVAVLCALAAAGAVYLVATEVRASRRPGSPGLSRAVIRYREPALLPLDGLRTSVTRLLVRSGPRVRIGAALSGLAGMLLVVTGAADIRVGGTACPSVCVVRVPGSEQDELAAGAGSPVRAAGSAQAGSGLDTQRAASSGVGAADVAMVTGAGMSAGAGSSLDGRGVTDGLPSRGLTVATDVDPCLDAGTTPRAFRTSRNGGAGQGGTLLVYPSRSALDADWDVGRGSPFGYRGHGSCGATAVVYWSQSNILIVPAAIDGATRQALAAEFFALR